MTQPDQPTKTIPGVPESITRDAYVALIRGAGFEPKQLLRLEFARDGIYAEVCAVDPVTGKTLIDRAEVVVDRVYVPVRDDQEATDV